MTKKFRPKVALGMSGGVDSSVSAHLLKQQGYDVTGVYLECWRAPGCRTDADRQDALKVALDLKIPFQVLDFKKEYKKKVVDYFLKEYKQGRTPNPDVVCNQEIKFGLFYDWALDQGFDKVATGHYAKIIQESLATPKTLAIPKDKHKDQTYFLYVLTQEQLTNTLFPLHDLTKDEVRSLARQRKLAVSQKKDSVGICFMGDINVGDFLKERLGENPGDVVDTEGYVIGHHRGLWFYTIGQRHGFEIEAKTIIKQRDGSTISRRNLPPFYVIDKNQANNQLVVGFGEETKKRRFYLSDPHWIKQPPTDRDDSLLVRVRHTGQLLPLAGRLQKNNQGRYQVELKKPERGLASGQAAVFYKKVGKETICLGGGTIDF